MQDKDNFVGRHLIVDVQTKTMRGINEPQVIYTLLEGLSKVIGMTLVYPPIVARFPFANSELEVFLHELKAEGIQAQTISKMEQLLEMRHDEL